MLAWLRKLLTTADNCTPDLVRILGALMGLQFILNSGWAVVVKEEAFNATDYGTGAGLILAAIGAALGLKRKAEEPST